MFDFTLDFNDDPCLDGVPGAAAFGAAHGGQIADALVAVAAARMGGAEFAAADVREAIDHAQNARELLDVVNAFGTEVGPGTAAFIDWGACHAGLGLTALSDAIGSPQDAPVPPDAGSAWSASPFGDTGFGDAGLPGFSFDMQPSGGGEPAWSGETPVMQIDDFGDAGGNGVADGAGDGLADGTSDP